jgi:hypothetical protein
LLDLLDAIPGREGLRRKLGKERVDERVTLLRRHVVLDRKHAMLAIDDIIADQTVEIRGEEKRVVADDVGVEQRAWLDVGRCREAANRFPERSRFAARAGEMFDEQMLDLMRGGDAAAPWQLEMLGEIGESEPCSPRD